MSLQFVDDTLIVLYCTIRCDKGRPTMGHQTQLTFDPSNLPESPTPVFNVDGNRIGTFNPHTLIIHPMGNNGYGPMKLLGRMAFDMSGKMVGQFTDNGQFNPA